MQVKLAAVLINSWAFWRAFLLLQAVSKFALIWGNGYLLWYWRKWLIITVVYFGFCSLALLLNSSVMQSLHRYAYGIVSLSIGLGLVLSSHPRWGYAVMTVLATFLLYMAVKFTACR
ncbi:hypothetical protein QUA46_29070 [Microcoleus sp. MON2_D6]|uniref:hypothetical protein n=2 Tax=unclassified Microcoleus TaxID=2642155 RepID=UPI002FD5411A